MKHSLIVIISSQPQALTGTLLFLTRSEQPKAMAERRYSAHVLNVFLRSQVQNSLGAPLGLLPFLWRASHSVPWAMAVSLSLHTDFFPVDVELPEGLHGNSPQEAVRKSTYGFFPKKPGYKVTVS